MNALLTKPSIQCELNNVRIEAFLGEIQAIYNPDNIDWLTIAIMAAQGAHTVSIVI